MIAPYRQTLSGDSAVDYAESLPVRHSAGRLNGELQVPGFPRPSLRVRASNPNHHLWNNNGTWYVHYTVHPTPLTKSRIRASLETKSLEVARQRRDEILQRAGACL